jgi:hypothetical protein
LVEVERVAAMEAHEALIAIQRLARIALASERDSQSKFWQIFNGVR